AARLGDTVHRAGARRLARRRARHQRHAAGELQRRADPDWRSDDRAVLQHGGVLDSRPRHVRQRGAQHDHRAGHVGRQPEPHAQYQFLADARALDPDSGQQHLQYRAVVLDRYGGQFADLRLRHRRARDAARPGGDEVQVLMPSRKQPQSSLSALRTNRLGIAPRPLRALRVLVVIGFAVCLGVTPGAQNRAADPTPTQRPVFRGGTELVLVNVVVRDKSGAVVRNLTQDDFAVTEDDRPQTIASFDFEELDKTETPASPEPAQPVLDRKLAPARPIGPVAPATPAAEAPKIDMHGRRLIVLFFDLSSMQPEEIERAAKAAHEYVDQKLSPADLIAITSFSTSLRLDLDFTSERESIDEAIDQFSAAS